MECPVYMNQTCAHGRWQDTGVSSNKQMGWQVVKTLDFDTKRLWGSDPGYLLHISFSGMWTKCQIIQHKIKSRGAKALHTLQIPKQQRRAALAESCKILDSVKLVWAFPGHLRYHLEWNGRNFIQQKESSNWPLATLWLSDKLRQSAPMYRHSSSDRPAGEHSTIAVQAKYMAVLFLKQW